MTHKHTAGPWTHKEGMLYAENDGATIANLYTTEANANLIAAAPELLEALEKWINFHEGNASVPTYAYDAVNRARGQS